MAATRIYGVTENETAECRLIEASSAAQALRHVAKQRYSVGTPSPREVAMMMTNGTKLETAGEEAAKE